MAVSVGDALHARRIDSPGGDHAIRRNRLPELASPDLIVVVVDASNLQRNLYYATQVVELGHRTIIALNMVDVATP